MDFDALRIELDRCQEKFDRIKNTLKIDEKREKASELEKETLASGFWEDNEKSSEVLSKLKSLKKLIQKIDSIDKEISEARVYLELAEEENDVESYKEAKRIAVKLSDKLEELEIDTLLSDEYDEENAIVTIHPGAGGTESQDWALMLYRMYSKWCLKKEFELEVLDLEEEDVGIKTVSFLVKGENAYGYLKSENGVHRLVRISPFDSNSRRHTSFASVEVMPDLPENTDVNINPDDIEMDVYRASGAGGQHINKTSSAVRLKHIPTGIVVTCQTERSQLQNRENAMKMLRAKIYKLERENYEKKMSDIKGESADIAWGSQIRSYVFCPYTLVKDHRTGYEVGNVEAVMDGKIDDFIYAYLKYIKENDII